MFNPTTHIIDGFVQRMQQEYWQTYSTLEPAYPGILAWAGHMALEHIASSDALYHNVEHTIMVTLVGQEILKGKHWREGGVTPQVWLHVIISLLYHDVGFVRGLCQDDCDGLYSTGENGLTVPLPTGATDAALAPYHVDRGKHFIRTRFADHPIIDPLVIATNIERTRFPIPDGSDHQGTADYPGLVRAADLIGQLADPDYLRKVPALYYEFEETGTNAKFGYTSPADLRTDYPSFFWATILPYIQDGLRYLSVTQAGKQWIANLYAHVFSLEHQHACTHELIKVPL